MSTLQTVAEWLVAICLVGGALISFAGAWGLLRLRDFFDRVHASTLCSSLGMAGVVTASIIYFSVTEGRFVIHALLIGIFVTLTTPVTLMLLARAAHLRRPEVRAKVGDDPSA